MRILDFPKLRQHAEYDCGAVVIEAILAYYGKYERENRIIRYAQTNARTGTMHEDILRVLRKYGLRTKCRKMRISALKESIRKGKPIILLLQAWGSKESDYTKSGNEHWVTAIGYTKSKIIFEDPYTFERTFLTHKTLKKRWHGKEGKKNLTHRGIVVSGKPRFHTDIVIPMR